MLSIVQGRPSATLTLFPRTLARLSDVALFPGFAEVWYWRKWRNSSHRPDPWSLTSHGRSFAMVIVADSVPGLKRWISTLGLKDSVKLLVIRMVVTFLLHAGRMSCLRAAGAVRCETRHRAQISRFRHGHVGGSRYQLDPAAKLAGARGRRGTLRVLIDATLTSQAGQKTANTYSTGNRKRRPRKRRRYGKYKHAQKNCHSFTMGLLITPSGTRIPFCKPYHTPEHCKKTGLAHRTTAQAAADRFASCRCRKRRGWWCWVIPRMTPKMSTRLAWTAATRGSFRATPNASWPARKASGRRCVRF